MTCVGCFSKVDVPPVLLPRLILGVGVGGGIFGCCFPKVGVPLKTTVARKLNLVMLVFGCWYFCSFAVPRKLKLVLVLVLVFLFVCRIPCVGELLFLCHKVNYPVRSSIP